MKYQQIISPKLPAHLLEDFLARLDEITVFNKTGSGLEIFFDIDFRSEKFTLHQDVNLWIVHDFDGNVSSANFEALIHYLAQHDHGIWVHIYLTLTK